MDALSKNILNDKISSKFIEPIFNEIIKFYDAYNPAEKINDYTTKVIKINKKTSPMTIIKESLFKLIRSKANLKIVEKRKYFTRLR